MKYLEFCRLNEEKHYVGNCQNSFDEDGECTVSQLPYRDTSHFAHGEENAHKISKEEFGSAVHVPDHLKKLHNNKNTIHMHDRDNDVHMMYDKHKDIHHFFT